MGRAKSGCIPTRLPTDLQNRDATREVAVSPELAAEIEAEAEAWYPVARHPIKHALYKAGLERSLRIRSLMEEGDFSLEDLIADSRELNELLTHVQELMKWLESPVRSEAQREARRSALAEMLAEAAFPLRQIVQDVASIDKPVRGRPPTTRSIAADALDLWHVNPRWNWTRVTREI